MQKAKILLYTKELSNVMATKSAYIHIPFCRSKCNYCSFVSYEGCNSDIKQAYVDTLLKEISLFYKGEDLKTLYFGGGTPSLLPLNDLKNIFNCFNLEKDSEVTIEINPETVDLEYLKGLKEIGFNRVSIGIQSFDAQILKTIGRIHTPKKAIETVKSAQKAGFSNISTDFIYGLPSQSQESFLSDLKTAVELEVAHISLYGLKIEEGCKFFENMPQNLPDDDTQADMYLAAISYLESRGFLQYEIGNFSKPNLHSRHNLNYWDSEEYYGFGAAAHGYVDRQRYSNFCEIKDYLEKYSKKENINFLTIQEQLEESVFLGFRRKKGINTKEINEKFNIDFDVLFKDVIGKYIQSGHILKTEDGYAFSSEGFLLSNLILSDFI